MTGGAGERPGPPGWVRPAAVAVARQRGALEAAMAAVAHPRPAVLALLLAAVAANLALSATCLRVLIARFGRVGTLEMQAVVATATLLNFLPLRPGLLGRVAWHRARSGIPATATLRTAIEAALISAAVAGA